MAAINERVASVIADIEVHDSPERFRSLGAEVFLANVVLASPHELVFDGETRLSAPAIILGTGSSGEEGPLMRSDETTELLETTWTNGSDRFGIDGQTPLRVPRIWINGVLACTKTRTSGGGGSRTRVLRTRTMDPTGLVPS